MTLLAQCELIIISSKCANSWSWSWPSDFTTFLYTWPKAKPTTDLAFRKIYWILVDNVYNVPCLYYHRFQLLFLCVCTRVCMHARVPTCACMCIDVELERQLAGDGSPLLCRIRGLIDLGRQTWHPVPSPPEPSHHPPIFLLKYLISWKGLVFWTCQIQVCCAW